MKPCLTCGALSKGTRCPAHTKARDRAKAAKRAAAPGDGAARRFRRALNSAGAGRCVACGRNFPAALLRVDHIRALADGGHDTALNLQLLCTSCHDTKSAEENRQRRNNN